MVMDGKFFFCCWRRNEWTLVSTGAARFFSIKDTKTEKNIPNGRKIFQKGYKIYPMAVKYTE
jgi:hypothetical protein